MGLQMAGRWRRGLHLHARLALRLQAIGRPLVAVELVLGLLQLALAALLVLHVGDLRDGQRVPDAQLAPAARVQCAPGLLPGAIASARVWVCRCWVAGGGSGLAAGLAAKHARFQGCRHLL